MSKILITGSTSGFGAALVEALKSKDNTFYLLARNEENLKQQQQALEKEGITAFIFPMDLSDPTSAQKLYDQVKDLDLDCVIQNAGFGIEAEMGDVSNEALTQMIQCNAITETMFTNLIVPVFKKKGKGQLVFTSSLAGLIPSPHAAVYGATKTYVYALAVALSKELRGSGVEVSVVCPGSMETKFGARSGMDVTPIFQKPLSAQKAAEVTVRAMARHKLVIVPGFKNKFYAFLYRIIPARLAMYIAEKMMRPKK